MDYLSIKSHPEAAFKKANNAEVSNEKTEKPSKSDSKKWKIDFYT